MLISIIVHVIATVLPLSTVPKESDATRIMRPSSQSFYHSRAVSNTF